MLKIKQSVKSFADIPENAVTHWAFAYINGRLSEFHWYEDRGVKNILGHCHVKKSSYKTKHEQKMIKEDIEKNIFTYRKKTGYKIIPRSRISR